MQQQAMAEEQDRARQSAKQHVQQQQQQREAQRAAERARREAERRGARGVDMMGQSNMMASFEQGTAADDGDDFDFDEYGMGGF